MHGFDPIRDTLHTTVTKRLPFSPEPFFLLPQTPGVTQTTCCCSYSNPKSMTSSRHTTYLTKNQHQAKPFMKIPCMIAIQSAHLMHASWRGHSSYEVLVLPCSKASKHKPKKQKFQTCDASAQTWHACKQRIGLNTHCAPSLSWSSMKSLNHAMHASGACGQAVHFGTHELLHRHPISCCICSFGFILNNFQERETQ